MVKKMTLGKGIASLIEASGGTPSSEEVTEKSILAKTLQEAKQEVKPTIIQQTGPLLISPEQIITNPNQPRKIFKDKELEELALSIKENGIIQPLIVSEVDNGGDLNAPKKYNLIAGERRLRASISINLDQVPVVIKRGTEREQMVMSIIENVQRSDLNCVEEALAYYQLIEDYKLTQEEVAKKIGKERSTVANFLRILKLPRKTIEFIQKDMLSFGHAKVLASVTERDIAIRLTDLAVAKKLTVRELEKLCKKEGRKSKATAKSEPSKEFSEMLDRCRQQLEQHTGFHFQLDSKKKNGAGEISIKFNNEAEFNDIFSYLMER